MIRSTTLLLNSGSFRSVTSPSYPHRTDPNRCTPRLAAGHRARRRCRDRLVLAVSRPEPPGGTMSSSDQPYGLSQETEEEKLTRNLNELLQELRVTQTGVQILTGF